MTIKIGDRVRLTAEHCERAAGPEGVVVPSRFSTLHLVKFDPPFKGNHEGEGLWYVPASKLALVGFKVGDRVTFTVDNPNGGAEFGAAGDMVIVKSAPFSSGAYGDQVTVTSVRRPHGFTPNAPVSALRLAVDEPLVATSGVSVEAGVTYVTREGRAVGPMRPNDGRRYDPTYPFVGDYVDGSGGSAWMDDGRFYAAQTGQDRRDIVSIEPAAAPQPAAEPARYKVGDKVRMSDGASDYASKEVTVEKVDDFDDCLPYSVITGDGDWRWVGAKDIVGLAEPAVAKVGDWVRAGDGRVGIVFHDDGDTFDNLHVGFIAEGDTDQCCADALTVIPAGASVAANDNFKVGDLLEVVDVAGFDGTRVRAGDIAKKVSGGSYEFPPNYRTRSAANAFTQVGNDRAFKRYVPAR